MQLVQRNFRRNTTDYRTGCYSTSYTGAWVSMFYWELKSISYSDELNKWWPVRRVSIILPWALHSGFQLNKTLINQNFQHMISIMIAVRHSKFLMWIIKWSGTEENLFWYLHFLGGCLLTFLVYAILYFKNPYKSTFNHFRNKERLKIYTK